MFVWKFFFHLSSGGGIGIFVWCMKEEKKYIDKYENYFLSSDRVNKVLFYLEEVTLVKERR